LSIKDSKDPIDPSNTAAEKAAGHYQPSPKTFGISFFFTAILMFAVWIVLSGK